MKLALHFSIVLMFALNIAMSQTNFSRIACNTNVTLNLIQGDSCSYFSDNDGKTENTKVGFEIYNNTLHIVGGNSKAAVVNVTVKDLKGLTIDGATRVKCLNTIKSDGLKLQLNGASKSLFLLEVSHLLLKVDGASQVELRGLCDDASIEVNGASKLIAKQCIFKQCKLVADGASLCSLDSVTSNLKVEVKGASKIYLRSIPEVYVCTRSGSGKIYDKLEYIDSVKTETNNIAKEGQADSVKARAKFYSHYGDAGFNWTGLNLGFNGLLNAANTLKAPVGYDYLEMNNASSIQVGLNLFEKDLRIYKHYVMGMIGAGFSWNNYKFTTPYVLQPYQPSIAAIKDTQGTFSVNKLRISYFNVPLLLGFNTSQKESKALHIAAGVVVGLRMGAMVKTSADNKDGKQHDKTFALYNTDQVRYDLMLRLKYKWANIWASYSMNGLFRANQGPEVHPVAIGVNLLAF